MPVFFAILMFIGLVATPVATPTSISPQPDALVVLPSVAVVRPLVAGDTIYVAMQSSEIMAVDAATGATLWITPIPTVASDVPAILQDAILVPGMDGTLYQMNAATGEVMGGEVLGSSSLQSPVIAEDKIVVPSSNGTVYALDPDTLELSDAIVVGSSITSRREQLGDSVVVPVNGNTLVSVDLTDLTIRWTDVTPSTVIALLAVSDDVLIAGQVQGQIFAMDADGNMLWQEVSEAAPVIDFVASGAHVLVSQNGSMVTALELETGRVDWALVFTGDVRLPAESCGTRCFVSVSDGTLSAVDSKNGMAEALAVMPAGSVSQPIQQANLLVYLTSDGTMSIWHLDADESPERG